MDWSMDPIFGSITLVLLIAVALILTFSFVRESVALTRRQAVVLGLLRILLCLLVILLLLKPGLTFVRQSSPRGTVAVMMDVSASMGLPSGESKQTRWEVENEIWQKIWSLREQLGTESSIVPFVYDSTLRPLGDVKSVKDGNAVISKLPERPDGASTDVGGPLNQLLSAPLESPLNAVIWMGDAAQTHRPMGADAQQLARQLGRLDIPMYLIGVGPRSDSENARDLAIEGVPEQLDVFSKSKLYIRGSLRAHGVANKDVTIRLMIMDGSKQPQMIERIVLRPTKADQTMPFQIALEAPDAGSYELLIRADPVEGESVEANNEAIAYLNVRGGGTRFLYLAGEVRYEMPFMRRALAENPDMQVDYVLIQKPPIMNWPVDLTSKLSSGVYDCFILGDLDFNAIGDVNARLISEQVKNGAGLVTLGGYHAYGPGGWDKSSISEILPVKIGDARRQGLNQPIDLTNHIPGPIPIVIRSPDPMLRLVDPPADNSEAWKSLKPMLGANRWEGVKNAPGIAVLAESPAAQPLIVVGSADKGRVASLAIDSTWQWWRQGKVNEHKRFWRQLLLWSLRREQVDEGMQLAMPVRRLYLQQSSEMTLQWTPGTKGIEMPKDIKLHLWKMGNVASGKPSEPDRDLGEFALSRRDGTSMRALFGGGKESGRYEWRAKTVGPDGKQIEAKLPFVILEESIESMQPMPDWQLMTQMAKLNESAGGELLAPEQVDDIISRIIERRKQATETVVENRRLGDGTIDSWGIFLAIAAVLITQWGLRKRWSLP